MAVPLESKSTGADKPCNDSKNPVVGSGAFLDDPILGIIAETVDDLEAVRVSNENRLRALTTVHGLTVEHPDVAQLAAIVAAMKDVEDQAIRNMVRRVRKHPLWPLVKDERGIGEKQFARLIATIHDPAWNDLYDRRRTCRELRAYCGIHVIEIRNPDNKMGADSKVPSVVGVAPKRQRGIKSNWSEDARKRLWLIASQVVQLNSGKYADLPNRSQYIEVYEKTRAKYVDAVHEVPCVRCGPKGKPAQPGSPLSLGHQHARGLRKMMSELLKDLWREAYRLHTDTPSSISGSTASAPAN